ncbi:MAG: hypothetical protein K2K39_01585, partial [Clostridia bacterium]|nr:hypothetical protein [Clostridia bacterium]
MKRKLITLTFTTAIAATMLSVVGCVNPTPPRAITEEEWKAAWQATYGVKNYTAEADSLFGNSTITK